MPHQSTGRRVVQLVGHDRWSS